MAFFHALKLISSRTRTLDKKFHCTLCGLFHTYWIVHFPKLLWRYFRKPIYLHLHSFLAFYEMILLVSSVDNKQLWPNLFLKIVVIGLLKFEYLQRVVIVISFEKFEYPSRFHDRIFIKYLVWGVKPKMLVLLPSTLLMFFSLRIRKPELSSKTCMSKDWLYPPSKPGVHCKLIEVSSTAVTSRFFGSSGGPGLTI